MFIVAANAPINVMPHPPVLGLTGGGGRGFVLKILPQLYNYVGYWEWG